MWRVLMTGGGTAGHINPALAIADLIRERHPDTEILFVGAKGRMETELVPAAGYRLETVDVRGFQRKLSVKNIGRNAAAAVCAVTAGLAADKIIRQFKPDVAIGTGGYVCGPVLRKAAQRGVPVLVHESNAYPGVTVKLLARHAKAILLCTEDARAYLPAEAPVIVTGNPLRAGFTSMDKAAARRELGVDDRPLIVSMGGSLGARAINHTMADVLARSAREGRWQHIHATGKAGYAEMGSILRARGVEVGAPGMDVRPYIHDMPRVMAAADLVICRCGAMTLSELPAAGKPSILIPSPYVAENHQYHNAMTLVKRGAAVCIEEKDLTADALYAELSRLADHPDVLREMGTQARSLAIPDADERIYAAVCDAVAAD